MTATYSGDLKRWIPDVGVQVVYQYRNHEGAVLATVGIPAAELDTKFLTHARVTDDGINMGLALANPSDGTPGTEATVVLNLYGEHPSSALVASTEIVIPRGGQLSRFLSELFPDLNENKWGDKIPSGSLEIVSDIPIAVAALRTETSGDIFALGSVPVFPARDSEE